MSDNVTPIHSKSSGPSDAGTPRKRSPRPSRERAALSFCSPPDEPSSLRIFQALHGVCGAAETAAENAPSKDYADQILRLATAAEILVGMLDDRML